VFAFLSPSSISFSFFAAIPKPASPPLPDRYQDYEIDGILDDIAAQGFLTPKASDYYSIHDEIHTWNQMFVIKSDEERHDAREISQYATTWIVAGFRIYRFFDTWQEGNIYIRHAEECFKFMQRLSIESVVLGRMLTSASEYARFGGRYTQSEELSRQAIEILQRQEDVLKEDIFKATDTLALALRRQSKWDEAISLLETNLKEQEEKYGQLDRLTLGTLNELGWLYHLKGEYNMAYGYLERARDGREKVFGPDHGPTQHTWQNLAACLTQLGDYPRATELYERALKGHTAMLGEDHFWVLHISSNLAQLLLKQGSAKRAEDLFSKVLKLREKILPENHPDIIRAKIGLANAYMMGSSVGEAVELAREAVQGFERLMGPDDKETIEARALFEKLCIK
jgi:tetratricopeptide (TPR) repeat protein